MLAKMTSKNQITIPKKIIEQLPDVEYFEVQLKDGIVMLRPLKVYDKSLEDDKFIRCALAGKAKWIISGDRHLLVLKTYQKIKILTPSAFLQG
jgi:predicted nucleic acid-binding protein